MPDPHSGDAQQPDIDWIAAERSPEFRELIKRRGRFVIPATAFFMVWYFGFIILAGYAPDFMGETFIWDGLTLGYVLALTQFAMVFGLGMWYLRKSDREFDPLAARVVEAAEGGEMRSDDGRFTRGADAPTTTPEATR